MAKKKDNTIWWVIGVIAILVVGGGTLFNIFSNNKQHIDNFGEVYDYHATKSGIVQQFAIAFVSTHKLSTLTSTRDCNSYFTKSLKINYPPQLPSLWQYSKTRQRCVVSYIETSKRNRNGCQIKYTLGKCPDICGDNICSTTENCDSCSKDCGVCAIKPNIDSTCSEFKSRFNDLMNTDQNGHFGFIETGKTWGIVNSDWGYGWMPNLSNTGCLNIIGLEDKELTFDGFDKYIFYKDNVAIICPKNIIHPYDNYNGDPVQACFKEFNVWYNQFKSYVSQNDPVYWDYLSKNKLLLFNYAGANSYAGDNGKSCYIANGFIQKDRGNYPSFTCDSIGTKGEPIYAISDLGNLRCLMHESGHWIEGCNHNNYLVYDKTICSTPECKIQWEQWW